MQCRRLRRRLPRPPAHALVRRRACCAPFVMLSASSRMITLCLPGGSVTFLVAKVFILLRTTSMPRSSEAFSSRTASLKADPRSWRARHRIDVVLPCSRAVRAV